MLRDISIISGSSDHQKMMRRTHSKIPRVKRYLFARCNLFAHVQTGPASGESDIPDNRPTEDLVPELTAKPGIEDMEKTKKLEGTETRQPCGRVVGIIRRHWREKQYCGSLRTEGDRAVTSGKGQATSALFMPVDRKASPVKVVSSFFAVERLLCAAMLPKAVMSKSSFQIDANFHVRCCRSHGCVSKPDSEMC